VWPRPAEYPLRPLAMAELSPLLRAAPSGVEDGTQSVYGGGAGVLEGVSVISPVIQ